jgi:hypothetical protein
MQSTAANTSQHQEHQIAQLSAVQDVTHATLHLLINRMNALAFNVSDAGSGRYVGHVYGSHGHSHGRMQGHGCGPPAYIGEISHGRGFPQKGFPPTMGTIGCPMGAPPGPLGGFQGGPAGGPPSYRAPPAINGRYGPTGGYGMPPGPLGMPPGAQANVQQQPCLNVIKRY